MRRLQIPAVILIAVTVVLPVRGQAPFHYPEAKHGKGELKIINGLPVLRVEGTPEEIGEQTGTLAYKPAVGLFRLADEFLKKHGLTAVYPVLLKTARGLEPQFPRDHLREIEAAAKASGQTREFLVFANSLPDLVRIFACSALIVDPARSATGGPLFGRNMDWPPYGPLPEYTLVTVCRPKGKRAFVSITFPGMLGCTSGMNDAGLALANLTVRASADKAGFDMAGVPFTLALRRVLEECATIEEAEALVRSIKWTIPHNVTVCDRRGGAVFEITPKTVAVRRATEGVCACTNHFRTKELTVNTQCPRYDTLDKTRGTAPLGLADVTAALHAVNQGEATIQTMVFEPAALKLHLVFGRGPVSDQPLKELDLKPLFAPGPGGR